MRRGTLGTAGVALVLGLLIAGCASLDARASGPAAANNLAKPDRWSGTVAERGRLVVFSRGRWSSLIRSGDMMYGVANDPTTGADIEIAFRRVEE